MKKLSLIYIAIFCSINAIAQDTLTMEQCRTMALQYNNDITAAAKKTQNAEYTAKSYRSNYFPNITASATGLYSTADGSFDVEGGNLPTLGSDGTMDGGFAYFPGMSLEYEIGTVVSAGISIEQPIYMGGKISAAYKMATLGEDAARANEKLARAEAVVSVEKAYALVVKAKEMNVVASKYYDLLIELHKNVESAYKHGMKPQNDVLKVRVKLNESEIAVRKAQNALQLAKMNLCHIIGLPLDADINVSDDFTDIEIADNETEGANIMSRPEYEMLDHQLAVAEQQVKLTRSDALPQVGLRGSYNYNYGVEVNDKTLLNSGNFMVLLNVNIPLFHFGQNSNKTKAAKAQMEQTTIERENLSEQMTLELTQAINNLDEALLEVELSENSMKEADENLRISSKQYEAGMETLSDHLEAQAMWQQTYQTKIDAQFSLSIAYTEFKKAAGVLETE